MILMGSCASRVLCLSVLGNSLAYYLDKTTLLYKYNFVFLYVPMCIYVNNHNHTARVR